MKRLAPFLPPLLVAAAVLAAPAAASALAPSAYLAEAAAGDLYEQKSSQLVLQSTQDAKVRSFATMMIRDHQKSSAMLKAAAGQAGVTPPPPRMMPPQQAKIDALTKASGAARDRLYWMQQKAAHQQALALHSRYARNGTAAPLKAAAGQIAPVVQQHLEMLDGKAHGAH